MYNAIRTLANTVSVCFGRYLVTLVVRKSGLTYFTLNGIDDDGTRYSVRFNPGDRFRDSVGWEISFEENGEFVVRTSPDVPDDIAKTILKSANLPCRLRIMELEAVGKRLARFNDRMTLSFRKNRQSFTLMFRRKAVRSFS